MPYSEFENTYKNLSLEQQMIIYNLAVSLFKMNQKQETNTPQKRQFGKFKGQATAKFANDWEMTEEELCSL